MPKRNHDAGTGGSLLYRLGLGAVAGVALLAASAAQAATPVNLSIFSWPGYGFWFIAQEKGFDREFGVDLNIQTIEDPMQSFSLMNAGRLDIVSSTSEFGPIAAAQDMPIRLVTFTNLSYGTDKIILGPGIESAQELEGRRVAVMIGGLQQIMMGQWLEDNGLDPVDDVEYMNLIMDDAAAAMIGGDVPAAELWDPYGTQVLEELRGATLATDSREEFWTSSGLLADGMYMRTDFIEENRDAAVGALAAYWKAVHFWQDNPDEGNRIIARGLNFGVSDVELVIGSDGTGEDGGLVPYGFLDAARFCGVAPGDPPYGQSHGQVRDHWRMVNEWWLRFGEVGEEFPPEAGVDCSLMEEIHDADMVSSRNAAFAAR